ncbi:maleylpyruvate isomerase N-terminal domain-containing protein [Rhodococcoides kyotonense]|uniref:TIGR03083 family protein n=1 Tax=Rhodococcoides kyotonense TaxID=398843 RepID=A0A239ITQ2_9NOCA|nr:maleylpyruvate isomerase N-terminal domain-containing protein [Rhodococcus kyotonensis]SNS96413.1 TIGR03083 family protein [Rhodococcus kyotonensis]
MSQNGLTGAHALATNTVEIAEQFGTAEWEADSACHGWRVHDLIGHMAFFFNFIADPNLVFPPNPSGTSERLNDAAVRERADWPHEKILDYYREQSEAGLATLTALQGEELRDNPIAMLDLGTYKLHQLADAVSFDHLVHLTSDLLAPFGPIPVGDVDVQAAIDPAIDWMLAGLPQMCGERVAPALTSPVALRLTGITERSVVLASEDGVVTVTETGDAPEDVATSSATDFLRWGTTRSAWRSAVTLSGDHTRVASVLDAIDIV